ncbi:MazG nucleotide pyrophosphohydrolase domain-containing protein [uncultured Celeribacter sp.]|uniref:MazG nucleotide pyrophosphohydrolase domain-containing protein n=1 Tax=uncultured Celeribacter sp. TaxID=1303376 RepID=UPI002AA64A72|nr:MazG nucleotide pyrophosphohydrolase domain-containing protein [uncultured Celeribacter sp.]
MNDIYVETFGLTRDGLMLIGKMTEEMGEVASAYLKLHGRARGADGDPETLRRDFEDELADLLGFLAVLAETEGVDLSEAFARKWGKYL